MMNGEVVDDTFSRRANQYSLIGNLHQLDKPVSFTGTATTDLSLEADKKLHD
jgi:hypothetical protein